MLVANCDVLVFLPRCGCWLAAVDCAGCFFAFLLVFVTVEVGILPNKRRRKGAEARVAMSPRLCLTVRSIMGG